MKKETLFLQFLFFILLFSCLKETKGQNQKIDYYIKPYVITNNFSGTVFVAQKGKVIYFKSFGKANLELGINNTNSTVYHLASVSKPFTSTAILLLEQQGKLSTSDKLSMYIPDFTNADKITIHHLLIHSSGIPNINNFREYEILSMLPQTTDSLISFFKFKKSEFEPGSKYAYSNSNYNVLAYIIEKASGMSYGDFLKQNIFKPLGMTLTSHHYQAGDVIENAATGYTDEGALDLKRASYVDWSSKTGNGSLYSTAEDLYRFCKSFSTDKLLTKSSRDKMFTNHISNIGYGWFLRPDKDEKRMYINGRSPGFTAFMTIYPDDDLNIIIMSNLYIPVPTEIGNGIASIIFGRPDTKREFNSDKLSPDQISAAVGKYQFDSTFFRPNSILEVSAKNGRLVTSFGGLTYIKKDSFVLRSFWTDLKFERDINGVITGLDYDGDKAKKIN